MLQDSPIHECPFTGAFAAKRFGMRGRRGSAVECVVAVVDVGFLGTSCQISRELDVDGRRAKRPSIRTKSFELYDNGTIICLGDLLCPNSQRTVGFYSFTC
jgi:hypothetical protein